MPNLQLTNEMIQEFEKVFLQEVQNRHDGKVSDIKQAYQTYLSFKDQKRNGFWEIISSRTKISRERVYKFFRFTWSRKFYQKITTYRDNIRQLVIRILIELDYKKKTQDVNQIVWKRVWNVYKDYNLHYDGTDQYVRNCVNIYFNKLMKGQQILPDDNVSILPQHQSFIDESSQMQTQYLEEEKKEEQQIEIKEDNYAYIGKYENQGSIFYNLSDEQDSTSQFTEQESQLVQKEEKLFEFLHYVPFISLDDFSISIYE